MKKIKLKAKVKGIYFCLFFLSSHFSRNTYSKKKITHSVVARDIRQPQFERRVKASDAIDNAN
jgi:hypothetical protein